MKKSIFLVALSLCVLQIFAQSKFSQTNVFHIASPGAGIISVSILHLTNYICRTVPK